MSTDKVDDTTNDELQSPSEFLWNEVETTWQWRIDTDPELAASLGLLSKRQTSTHALDPRSLQSFAARLQWVQSALDRIQHGMSKQDVETKLTKDEQLTYKLYTTELQRYVECTPKYRRFLCCVNRLEGPQVDLPLYASNLPLATPEQQEFYRDFLKAIAQQIDENIELLTQGLKEKRTPAKASVDGVPDQLRAVIGDDADKICWPLRYPIVQSAVPFDDALKKECFDLLDTTVKGSLEKLAQYLETDYMPNLPEDISAVTGYPDGADFYRDCLQFHTTTSEMTPSDVHQLGLDEVDRIRKEMEEVAAQAGYKGRLNEYLEYLRTSSEFSPTSAEAHLTNFRDIIGRIAPQLLKIIHLTTLPRLPLQVVETPEASAGSAPAAYYLSGSCDVGADPRPGTFYVNTSGLSQRRTYECEVLALHEATPGHHTQGSIQGEATALPSFRRYMEDRRYFECPCRFPIYTAYVEGWALHCETLGKDLGLYKTLPSQMGQLSLEAFRACRLVVDTGIHTQNWTLDQALKYMLQHTALAENDAAAEVARYVTWPGQATGYKVGERCIHSLRAKAETELGDKFDPRDFYDVVLLCGPVPIDVLEQLVKEYIEKKKKGGTADPADAPVQSQPADANEMNMLSGDDKQQRRRRFLPFFRNSSSSDAATVASSTMDSSLPPVTTSHWCRCCAVPGACPRSFVVFSKANSTGDGKE